MKSELRLKMRPANTQEMQLICNCCGHPYYPNKVREDQQKAIIFGAEKYTICPLCTQSVPDEIFRDGAYRQRCHYEVARLQLLSNLKVRHTHEVTAWPNQRMRN